MFIAELKKLLPQYDIVAITKQNIDCIVDIYKSNRDYFMLSSGHPASIQNCLDDLEQIPPDVDREKKTFSAFIKDGKTIAVVEFLEGCPKDDECWLGILLVHQDFQGKGIGREIVEAVLDAAAMCNFSLLQLGVIDCNQKAYQFWKKLGFEKVRERKIKQGDGMIWNIIVMKKTLLRPQEVVDKQQKYNI